MGTGRRWGVELDRAEQDARLLKEVAFDVEEFDKADFQRKQAMAVALRGACSERSQRDYLCELARRYTVRLAEDRSRGDGGGTVRALLWLLP